MTLLRDDDVIDAMAMRHPASIRAEVAEQLREVWMSIAPELSPEEQAVVVWSLSPLAVAPGSISHRAHMARVAVSMFPGLDRGKAVAKLRSILKRPAVVAALASLRSEETAYLLAERALVRELAFAIAAEGAPEEYEPKDRIAHNKTRLAAAKMLVDLDGLGVSGATESAPVDAVGARKKIVAKLDVLVHKLLPGETTS